MKSLGNGNPDHAHADDADCGAVDAGEVVGHHPVAEGDVVTFLDFGIGPGKTPQQ